MRNYRTLAEVSEEYFAKHPEEIERFLAENFEEFAEDGDAAALLAALRIVARVNGISEVARKAGMTRQGLQKALSAKGNPRLQNINLIMRALGYRLSPKRIEVWA